MQPVLLADVVAVARVLLARPASTRARVLYRIWREAQRANTHRKRIGRPHPVWGDGSLGSAALRRPHCDEPFLTCPDYIDTLILILDRLKSGYPRMQDTQRATAGSSSSRASGMPSPHSVQ